MVCCNRNMNNSKEFHTLWSLVIEITVDLIISTFLINHLFNYPLRQKPPLQKSTQPFSTTTKIHSAFFHHY